MREQTVTIDNIVQQRNKRSLIMPYSWKPDDGDEVVPYMLTAYTRGDVIDLKMGVGHESAGLPSQSQYIVHRRMRRPLTKTWKKIC